MIEPKVGEIWVQQYNGEFYEEVEILEVGKDIFTGLFGDNELKVRYKQVNPLSKVNFEGVCGLKIFIERHTKRS